MNLLISDRLIAVMGGIRRSPPLRAELLFVIVRQLDGRLKGAYRFKYPDAPEKNSVFETEFVKDTTEENAVRSVRAAFEAGKFQIHVERFPKDLFANDLPKLLEEMGFKFPVKLA